MTTETKPAFNPAIRALADDLKTVGKVNGDTRQTDFEGSDDIFSKHMPEGQTLDSHKAHQDFLLIATSATTLANGELQQESMQKDKDHHKGSFKVLLGHASIEGTYDRERSGTAMGKPWKNHGVAKTDLVVGTGRKLTDHNKVVNYLSESAKSVFDN